MYSDGFEPPRSGRGKFIELPPATTQRYVTTEIYQDSPSVYRPTIENTQLLTTTTTVKNSYANQSYYEETRIDCTPGMCSHPYALLRWFELVIFFIIHWLVQITCARTTCTMILNEFGYKAYGQALILCIITLLAAMCALILIAYSLNFHKARAQLILNFERLYASLGVVLMTICGIIGAYHAAQTTDPEYNLIGRGDAGIRPQWIAAAVIEFLTAFIFVADLLGMRRPGFPFVYNRYSKSDEAEKHRKHEENLLKEQELRERYY
uniref:Uncharacterized protein n=1 Tax=Panagrolaimus sp. PS1159 TaxID=55785 RepID=A0AC35GBE2_9BILA